MKVIRQLAAIIMGLVAVVGAFALYVVCLAIGIATFVDAVQEHPVNGVKIAVAIILVLVVASAAAYVWAAVGLAITAVLWPGEVETRRQRIKRARRNARLRSVRSPGNVDPMSPRWRP